jgi:hypothetical protein
MFKLPMLRSLLARKIALAALAAVPAGVALLTPAPVQAADAARKSVGDVSFVLPAGWTLDENPRPMRLATVVIGDGAARAEVVLSQLGGNFGGAGANVNRWRGMAGLPPLADAEAEAALKPVKFAGVEGKVLDAAGEGDAAKRVVVVFGEKGGTTYFFRLIGPAKTVGEARQAFDAFVASIEIK